MLYIVATPIGNLGDITQRALDTLQLVDYVISEDTRKTGILLKHFEIQKPQISFREDNEQRALPRILELLEAGKSLALVTDAGTPAISDPGFVLVRAVVAAGLPLTSIPGPTALIAALVISGLPVHSFTFRGFPPHKRGPRLRFLQLDATSPHTLIFYESPYRLKAFLEDAREVYGDRRAVIANDLTKFYEAVWRGSLSELSTQIAVLELKGEFVVLIEGLVQ
ncbi:MAG TPA: 16S rRNA (cytidine(1402)-2'-O)-methyltransferase [Anaerolineaceae bacterium]|nr:16S rRNA (cytidine(1402)-2'-O)-methyltransferase [Anaerolineaceae bacterium]